VTVRSMLRNIIESSLENCRAEGTLTSENFPPVVIEIPVDPAHGDFATNIAMQLAKFEKKAPRTVAAAISEQLARSSDFFEKIDIAGPGFINFYLRPSFWQSRIPEVLIESDAYGRSTSGQGRQVQVEFVSANPTGPLHIGHGRGAAIGDTLCRLLEAAGWEVSREFYYNDAGQQIANLALSVQARCFNIEPGNPAWPDGGYQGEYIRELARSFLACESVESTETTVTASGDARILTISGNLPLPVSAVSRIATCGLLMSHSTIISWSHHFIHKDLSRVP